ncbi:Pre-neck appendage protein [Actinidia chinensis var. chinensis]|uniref:Pre-neck appendage protein n=1 Tax=Actinidia chinensis var. chinensis TaxID=1590841 RepID=A0A2R6PS46_ACTCC|nr:Pre-neck appendage protein [Actinidia chinensis var. chinensis]
MGFALFCWAFVGVFLKAQCDTSEVSVKFLKTPHAFSNLNSATFAFEVLVGPNGDNCTNCITNCMLDHSIPSNCDTREASYTGLRDGNHTFEVCTNASQGIGCASYDWIVDTVPPTAYVTAATSLTNAFSVPVNISFSEPCTGGGGFGCLSTNSCNLLVYGAGQVVPTTLNILEPYLKFSLVVSLSSSIERGRVILVMDKSFCTDNAGNEFTRTANSSFWVHFDRSSVFVNLRTHVPEKLLQLNSETRTVQATNNHRNMKVYLYFSEPVLNSSSEMLNSLHTSQGSLLPIIGNSLGNRRFGFMVDDRSSMCIVTVSLNSSLIISRQGTPVSPVAPVTFLYDSQRPAVSLSTTSGTRTREDSISVLIKFMKPVFGFNSSHISISGGNLLGFREVSKRIYVVEAQPDNDTISISIPENVTQDVAGNKNMASEVLQVEHYSAPVISLVLSTFATAAFAVTALVAWMLTLSTTSLQSVGTFLRPSSSLTSDPARNLFRIACHIQVFALSRWLAVTLPVEYDEFARGLQWSIPYFSLPWEKEHVQSVMVGSSSPTSLFSHGSKIHKPRAFKDLQPQEKGSYMAASVYGLPLTPAEYRSFFESQNIKPEAQYIVAPHNSNGWRDFNRSMFWLAVVSGSLLLIHGLLLLILRFRKKNSEKKGSYGALIFPRFEIFLLILALPCICEASATLIQGGASSKAILGIIVLGFASFLLLALFFFLSIGVTFGKLLQYKEVHQEGQNSHWYRHIVLMILGPGKRGQWTWKNQPNSVHLTMLGPLFEDLRGPPKYMLSQISRGNPRMPDDRIIASDDETEDAEAPFIQKLFGILRIYYTLLENTKRVCLGIVAGAYSQNWSSKTPIITLLCITSFQLFFLVLKKPFIKKKIQLVEIISVSCELGIFATCFALLEMELSTGDETKIVIFMLLLFFVAFSAQMANEWYALYKQTKQLDPAGDSFLLGLKTAMFGFLVFFVPQRLIKNLERMFLLNQCGDSEPGDPTLSGDRCRSSGSRTNTGSKDKPWMKQLREMAKAGLSRDGSGNPNDPSTSRSGFWSNRSNRRSGSSSHDRSADFKSKPRDLYKDLETIFA